MITTIHFLPFARLDSAAAIRSQRTEEREGREAAPVVISRCMKTAQHKLSPFPSGDARFPLVRPFQGKSCNLWQQQQVERNLRRDFINAAPRHGCSGGNYNPNRWEKMNESVTSSARTNESLTGRLSVGFVFVFTASPYFAFSDLG